MQKLSSQVLLYEPAQEATASSKDAVDPSVILLFGWVDAAPSHLEKYTAGFRDVFPTSKILVILSNSGFFFASEYKRVTPLEPVVHFLKSEIEAGGSKGILAHVMSNGGGFEYMTLRKMLAKAPITSSSESKVPIAVVFDSTPGDNGLESALLAHTGGNPILRIITVPVIAMVYGIFHFINYLRGNPPIFDELRASYLEPHLLPFDAASASSKATLRLYIYSKTDTMSLAKNVERHIDSARSLGFDVAVEVYEKSPHVAHARTDPDRYWNAIRQFWLRVQRTARL